MMKFFRAVKRAISEFSEDECMSSGAAMAYYAIFSIPPLLVLVFLIASWAGVSQQRIDQVVKSQLGISTSADQGQAQDSGAGSEQGSDESAAGLGGVAQRQRQQQLGGVGTVSRIVGVALLIFSATGFFAQLQFSLNRAWEVEPDPAQGGVVRFLLKRFFSLGMILVVVFLLLVSLVFTTLIDEIVALLQGSAPSTAVVVTGFVLNNLAVFVLATLLFAAMFKILPDAKMAWRDTWVGAAITALLFVIGKAAIGWYLQSSDVGAGWGAAAASMISILIWIYYASLIVLFGAELTQVWANEYGSGIEPAEGAIRKVEHKEHVRDSAA